MSQNSGLMQGKRGVILGVRQQPLDCLGHRQGLPRGGRGNRTHLAGDALKKRVEPLAKELGGILLAIATFNPMPRPSTLSSTCSRKNGARSTLWSTQSRSRQGPARWPLSRNVSR